MGQTVKLDDLPNKKTGSNGSNGLKRESHSNV